MRVLGIRCWAAKLSFVVLENGSDPPTVVEKWHGAAPKHIDGAERLEWFRREISQAIERCNVDAVTVRVSEPNAQKIDPLRAEADGVAQLAAFQAGKSATRAHRVTMASALGATKTGEFAAYPKSDPFMLTLHADEREAAMAALASLHRSV